MVCVPWASVGILSRASRAKATARVLSGQAEVWLPPGEAKVGAVPRSQVCAKCLHPETSPPPTPRTTLTFPGSQERKLITYSSLVKMYPSSSFRMPNRVPTTRAMPTGKDKGTAWTGQPEAMTQLGSAQCYSCTIRPLPDTPACCAEEPRAPALQSFTWSDAPVPAQRGHLSSPSGCPGPAPETA